MRLPFYTRSSLIWLLAIGLILPGCQKAFLAKKPSSNLLVPNSLAVLQELLDNQLVMNVTPALGEISADNFYFSNAELLRLSIKEYNAYIWSDDLYEGQGQVSDWDDPYQQVFYANTVLHGLAGIQPDSTDQTEWNMLKGWALFCRSYAFFNIAELFAEPYDSATAMSDPGIPIRLNPDINSKTTRATMAASYAQILNDLNLAEGLLPTTIPINNLNRPSRQAVQALLARIYLSVRDYSQAGLYADSVLKVDPFLLDYNTQLMDTASSIPFMNMPEVIYQSNFPTNGNSTVLEGLVCAGCDVDTNFLWSYGLNDLRPLFYYKQVGTSTSDTFTIKGSYAGTIFAFSGFATDELYLIRAECNARAGQVSGALTDLNALLSYRLRAGTFMPYTISGQAELLDSILVERRKELAFRGIRWSDLRRFWQENRGITLYRKIDSVNYSLSPDSSRLYTLPIPPDVIRLTGIQQNPR
jgi:starch-binding outer membrane protein, SusD/RagB family